MLRETIHADIGTDVELEIAKLRERCLASGLDTALSDLLIQQANETLTQLVEQGQRIASVGSQMEATRELSGEGYRIRLLFSQGVKKGLLQRLLDKLKGA